MLRERITTGIDGIIAEHGLPWHVTTAGAKGCITFLPEPTRNLRDFLQVDGRFGEAHWLVQHNGGVFLPPWGKIEQWLISVQHTDEDVDRFVANVRTLDRCPRRRRHRAVKGLTDRSTTSTSATTRVTMSPLAEQSVRPSVSGTIRLTMGLDREEVDMDFDPNDPAYRHAPTHGHSSAGATCCAEASG